MRIKLVVEDAKKGKIELPLNLEEVAAMYDLPFMLKRDWRILKLNKVDKPLLSLTKKFQHIEQDVIGDGRAYRFDGRGKSILSKQKFWMVKRPKWKKSN